jgi:selenocysteine-specific translation elongation factor
LGNVSRTRRGINQTNPAAAGWEQESGIAFGLVLRLNSARITIFGMTTISLKLPERLLELLEAESRARRTTKSSLVRECLEQTLAARPQGGAATCYDLARNLAGAVKGLPRDLATNPKYLEGFGR